jgi:hypothetical protein
MQIKVTLESVRQTRWYEFGVRFFFGGAITAIAGVLAKKFGPAFGGLFLAFPAIFPAAATIVEKHERQKKEEKGLPGSERGRDAAALDAAGAAMGSLGLILFAVMVSRLLPEHSAPVVLSAATIVWMLASAAIWFARERRRAMVR